jgi:hypothetical protein
LYMYVCGPLFNIFRLCFAELNRSDEKYNREPFI